MNKDKSTNRTSNGLKVYFATDHAGFELKNKLLPYVRDELGYDVEDCGAHEYNKHDDYPNFVAKAAEKVARDPSGSRAIILGASGQGEAMCANRFKSVRAAVYYGTPSAKQTDVDGNELDIITSTRKHNDANILSLGARFLSEEEAREAVRVLLRTEFSGTERHLRRIHKIEEVE